MENRAGEGGRERAVEGRVHDVRGHDRRDPGAHGAAEGKQFAAKERLLPRPDDGKVDVGVGGGVAVSGEMLCDGEDPPGERSPGERDPEGGRDGRVIGKGTVPDHRVGRVAVHVEDRGEVHVDPHGAELGGGRGAGGFRHVLVPATEEGAGAGGWKPGERGVLEPRHAASLLVDGDQREGIGAARGGSDLAAQSAHLGGGFDVPGEQDDAADLPACEPSRQGGRERLPVEADPQGGGDGFRSILHRPENLPRFHPHVECVAQPVPQEVERHHREKDRRSGCGHEVRRDEQEVPSLADH